MAEDYVKSRDLSERANGYVTARTTFRAADTPGLRMMMLPVSVLKDWEQKLYMPFSKWATRTLRHDCVAKRDGVADFSAQALVFDVAIMSQRPGCPF